MKALFWNFLEILRENGGSGYNSGDILVLTFSHLVALWRLLILPSIKLKKVEKIISGREKKTIRQVKIQK